jgi:hypothetical protein
VPSLTPAEKAAGRVFRDAACAALTALHSASPADLSFPVVVHHPRHLCAALDDRSISFECREVYQLSPDGIFAFIYKEGKCRHCQITSRSQDWLFVLAAERPPLKKAS